MIVSLRGTNGAGKSTIVHRLLSEHEWVEIMYPGRKRPRGYVCPAKKIFVAGHYHDIKKSCGVDTLPSLDVAYELIEEHARLGLSVLYEGKNMTDGTVRLVRLRDEGLEVAVAFIDIPWPEALKSVRERGHKIKKETVKALSERCYRQLDFFSRAGIITHLGDRASVDKQVRQWLKLKN